MSRFDSIVSSEAWERLVSEYRDLGGEEASDFAIAEMLRNLVQEIEGDL